MSAAQAIIEAIDKAYDSEKPREGRAYIGASIVGYTCDAMLAFQLRGFPDNHIPARVKRIFNTGHWFEDYVVKDLKKAGVSVWEVDGLTGKQHAYTEWGGHVVCHMDGHCEVDGKLCVLEVKSMNESSFTKFKSSGVKLSHPKYFAQMQMMMGMSGIHEALFIALSKNTQEYHAELVGFDIFEWSFIQERIGRALLGTASKIASDETDWRCRECPKSGACWTGALPTPLCRNCRHSEPTESGGWRCTKSGRTDPELCSLYEPFHPQPKR